MTELQSFGLRLLDPSSPNAGVASRRGGAGPSDHKAVTVDGHTIMVPVHTSSAWAFRSQSTAIASSRLAFSRSALLRSCFASSRSGALLITLPLCHCTSTKRNSGSLRTASRNCCWARTLS